jgi:hypothetical protein
LPTQKPDADDQDRDGKKFFHFLLAELTLACLVLLVVFSDYIFFRRIKTTKN